MLTKSQVTKMLSDMESFKTRTDAAEAKIVALESEKQDWISKSGGLLGANSDEQRAMRAFGKSHVKELLNVNVGARQWAHIPGELKMYVLNLKRAVDIARLTTQIFNGDESDKIGKNDAMDRTGVCKGILTTTFGKEVLAPTLKAFGTTVAGGGAEWIWTAVSQNYLDEFTLARVLEARFQTVPMPSKVFDMPTIKGTSKARIATEGQTGFAQGSIVTGKVRLSAVKLEEFFNIPDEMTQDTAPDFLGAARDAVIASQEKAAEAAIVSGDSDGTHIDSDTQAGGADLAEKAWDGLRKMALANSGNGATHSFTNAAITETELGKLRARMGKYGSGTEGLVWIAGPSVYQQFVNLQNVSTVDKYGPMATVLKGALAAWQGIPILNSEHFREDLAAAGVHDGVTTNRAGLLLVNTSRFMIGNRMPVKVKMVDDLPGNDGVLVASYRRVAFGGHAQDAVEKSVVYGHDIAK